MFCSRLVVSDASCGFCWAFLVVLAHCFSWNSSVGFSSVVVPFLCVSVLAGISFSIPFPGRAVSIYLAVLVDVYLFSWFVGLVAASAAVSASISAVGVLVASSVSALLLVLEGH